MDQRPRTQTMGAGGHEVLLHCLRHDMHSPAVRATKVLSEQTAPFVVSGRSFATKRRHASKRPAACRAPSRGRRMRTLVLNAGYEPLAVVSFKRALLLVMNDRATVLESVVDDPVWTTSTVYDRPAVIVLTHYIRLPKTRRTPATRRGVLRRDAFRCAYCGESASTIDHVLPRSRGGDGSWENLVACCLRCNNIKSDRTPQEMGWELRIKPRAPRGGTWVVRGAERAEASWEPYLGVAA